MVCGPDGASGFVNGFVASQASKATRYSGRKRLRATRAPFAFPASRAVNHALNIDASAARNVWAASKARFAFVRVADALARLSEDSVPHLAAAKPDQAATTVTTASRRASVIEMMRSCRSRPD